MKICFYHQTFPDPFDWKSIQDHPVGGTQSVLINIAHELNSLGVDITVCNKAKTQSINGVKYQEIYTYTDFIIYENNSSFDVVIYVGPELEFAVNYAPNLKTPIKLMWAHNGWHPNEGYAVYDAIVCVSNSMRLVYSYLPIFEKTCFIHNGIVADYFPDFLLKKEKMQKVIFIGSIVESKGLHHILRVWSNIKSLAPTAELIVAGSAKIYGIHKLGKLGIAEAIYEENFLKPYLFDSTGKLRNDIKFLGSVPQKELGDLIASCRVALVNPNWRNSMETCCNAALEAQASGTPVVGVNQGSLPEVIQDGVTGTIIYEQDDNQYAIAVANLLNNPILSKTLGRSAREFMFTNFTYELQAVKWLELLESLVRDRSIPYSLKSGWYQEKHSLALTKWILRKTKLGSLARKILDNYRKINN